MLTCTVCVCVCVMFYESFSGIWSLLFVHSVFFLVLGSLSLSLIQMR